MTNFNIHFAIPWLLFLLIPALAITLIPYFRVNKKYRRTRSRVLSVILHTVAITCAVLVLAGMEFRFSIPNDKNELILLVDVSQTQDNSEAQRNDLVGNIIDESYGKNVKIGVVTFGFDQTYAVPLTDDVGGVYDAYLNAELPDTSATDIASALTYAKGLFANPETGKIVLITDGKETDEEANSVIRSVAAQGTRVDVAYIADLSTGSDVQIVDVQMPEYHVNVGDECTINISLSANTAGDVRISLKDNDTPSVDTMVRVVGGTQTFPVKHTFAEDGLHSLEVGITMGGDSLSSNNHYFAYYNLENFNQILIVERYSDSDALVALLEDEGYDVKLLNLVDDADKIPATVDGLRLYDQIILNNVSNGDLANAKATDAAKSLDQLIYSYVSDYGGGLFTVGGNDDVGNIHAYDVNDMYGTDYQKMLPVDAIDYTPPLGLVIILDKSGSMSDSSQGTSKLELAKAGAATCLSVLSERDYVGIIALNDDKDEILRMTERTKEAEILAAIDGIENPGGSTVFSSAIERAGRMLSGLNVAKRHMMIITDGGVNETGTTYLDYTAEYFKNDGTTTSIVLIDGTEGSSDYIKMVELAVAGGHSGDASDRGVYIASGADIAERMRKDLTVPEIKGFNPEPFKPVIADPLSPIVQGLRHNEGGESGLRLPETLGGIYGTRVKKNSQLILTGDYNVPLYAQKEFGKGMVGSFMYDLKGEVGGSYEFMHGDSGKQFLLNAINNLLPTENIRPTGIEMELKGDNYFKKVSIYTALNDGEYIEGSIVRKSETGDDVTVSLNSVSDKGARDPDCYTMLALSSGNNYSRCNFVVRQGGVYKIVLVKRDAQGEPLDTLEKYFDFSYSKEYEKYDEDKDPEAELKLLAERGEGKVIADFDDTSAVFDGFVVALDRSYDPRLVLAIIAMVLFLLDIVVRKFKFKWLHEIIRERRNKKNGKV